MTLSDREPGTALALFRAAIGACVLISLGSVAWHGDVAALWLGPAHGGYRVPGGSWLFDLLGGADPFRVHLVLGMSLAAGALLVVGLGGRFSAAVALLGTGALTGLNRDASGSYDLLLTNALWLLVLGESTATLSVDCWLKERRWQSARTIWTWPRRLAVFQLAVMYTSSGLQKVSDTWVPGGKLSAVYYVMQQPSWHRFDMRWLAYVFPLTQLATLLVWCFELSWPLLLLGLWLQGRGKLSRWPLRRVWAGFGVCLHLGIAATLILGCFPWLAMSFYLALIPGAVRISRESGLALSAPGAAAGWPPPT